MPASPLPPAVQDAVQSVLGGPLRNISRLSGGDTSAAYRLERGAEAFVVKVRQEQGEYPALFFAEAQGLHLLRQTGTLAVPEVVGYGTTTSYRTPSHWTYLILHYLPPAAQTPQQQEALGQGLAALHRHTAPQFGGTPDNFMGSLPQANPAAPTAAEFFWQARLEPQLRRAGAVLTAPERQGFERLREHLPALIPTEPPALVHGDLWHGNVLYTSAGPALIDPAATFSHREVDLSLMRLFGGFNERVFAAYQEALPLAAGWQARADLWNLYPLLVHVNLFGGSYLERTRKGLQQTLFLI